MQSTIPPGTRAWSCRSFPWRTKDGRLNLTGGPASCEPRRLRNLKR
jgi:hypothetical protein